MKTLKQILVLALSLCFIYSCEKDKEEPAQELPVPGGPSFTCDTSSSTDTLVLHGTFIVNEGAFGSNTGSVSFYSSDSTYSNGNLYQLVNGSTLGDIVQSMNIYNRRAFIVVNNSQKVEVVSMENFQNQGTITGFSGPRYILPVNNSKAYVSDWFANELKIVDLNTLSVTGVIPVGAGPEQMAQSGNKVYVTNVGGFGSDSTVSVVDVTTDMVIKTINVGVNPNSVLVDGYGMLWVLCGGTTGPDFTGGTPDDIGGKLIKIDPATDAIVTEFSFQQFEHPLKITSNCFKNKLYYLNGMDNYTGKVYIMDASATNLPSSPVVSREFYGLGIQPGNENIYGGVGNFSSNSFVVRYNSSGTLIDSIAAGIGPNGIVFN